MTHPVCLNNRIVVFHGEYRKTTVHKKGRIVNSASFLTN